MHNVLLDAIEVLVSVPKPVAWRFVVVVLLYVLGYTHWAKASVIPKIVEVWVRVSQIDLLATCPFLPLRAPWRVKVDGLPVC